MHEQADYYEADFDDDDPRLDLMLDCDTDLRLAHLWQHLFERDDVPEDALELVGALIRGAFDEGYNTAVVGDGDRRIDRQLRASGVRAGARPIRVTTRHTATRRSQSEYDPSQRPHLALAELPEGTVQVNRGHSCRAQPRFRLRGEQRSRQRGHSSVIQAATPQSRRGHPPSSLATFPSLSRSTPVRQGRDWQTRTSVVVWYQDEKGRVHTPLAPLVLARLMPP
jgi:hypothetical protein